MKRITLMFFILYVCATSIRVEAQRKTEKSKPTEIVDSEELRMKAETTFIEAEKQLLLENNAKAYELFMLTKQLNPKNAAVYFKLAEVLVKNGENEKGLENIEEAIDFDANNKYYYLFKAEILKALNRADEAIKTYETLVRLIPGNDAYYLDVASLYQYQGKWDKSLDAFNKAENSIGMSHIILAEKQKLFLKKNDMKGLITEWDRYIENFIDEPAYILELASLLVANELIDEAQKRLFLFRERFPENPSADLILSEIALKKGDIILAINYLKNPVSSGLVALEDKIRVLNNFIGLMNEPKNLSAFLPVVQQLTETNSSNFESFAFAGDIYLQTDSALRAISFYLKATELAPENYVIWQNIVNLEWQTEQYDSLIKHTERALEYFPNQVIFYFYAGTAYYIKENFKRAIQLLEQGKKYTTESTMLTIFYGQLGDAYNSAKDYSNSDNSYLKALEVDPKNDHALNNFSYFLSLRKEKLSEALEMSTKLIGLHPDNPTYLDTHGWVLYVMERFEEAESFLKKATELDNSGTILEHYGDVLFKLNREDEALFYWEKARQIGGATDFIDKKINDRKLYE